MAYGYVEGINLDALIYQLEKVDQAGSVADLFEGQLNSVAEAFGLPIEDDEESPYYGDIRLPDGRHATLTWETKIT